MFSHTKFYGALSTYTTIMLLISLVHKPHFSVGWLPWVLGSYVLSCALAFVLHFGNEDSYGPKLNSHLKAAFIGGFVLLFDTLMWGAPIYFVCIGSVIGALVFAAVGFIGTLLLGSYLHSSRGI